MRDLSVLVGPSTPGDINVDRALYEPFPASAEADLAGRRQTVEEKEVKRDYSNVKPVVVDHYRNLRSKQTHAHVLKMHEKFKCRERRPLKVWEALEIMATIVDTSDPDISLPNLEHLYQTAEGLREEGAERWLVLAGLMHDLGKVMFFWDEEEDGTSIGTQWSVTGDSFITGCAFPDGNGCIFPEFNQLNPDWDNANYNTKYGVYKPNCGLGNTFASWGHDEYLYQVLTEKGNTDKHTLPPEALYIIRFHSCYPWHSHGAYEYLEDAFDKRMKPIVKQFQKHDLYTKKDEATDMPSLEQYYRELVAEFFGDNILEF